ncbi:DNA polymerase I [Alphaproteobacteria bacterium HT1-32]|nr:DNA polymerase I [Alphaproteobacteria bacterium HT1-32]
MTERALEHLYLVDGSGYIFRAYHALPPMNRPDGTPTNAVYGFCNMLMKLMEDTEADHIAVIFDAARKNFRNDIYPEYKANRDAPPEDLIPQFALIRQAVEAFNLKPIEMEGFEADDLIATYARQAREKGAEVTIVSSDKDLMQLVRDGVAMMDPMKNRKIGLDEVMEKFGVAPDRVVDVQSLAGDSVDNVPGVPGIGVKTAALLINEYGDLDTLLARAGEIKQNKRRENLIEFAESARISRELVRLRDDVDVDRDLDAFIINQPNPEVLLPFLEAQNFRTLYTKYATALGAEDTLTATAENVDYGSYELVQDEAALKRWIAEACRLGVVAVDTETTSLNALKAKLVGVSLSTEAGKACYIPLGHVGGGSQGSLDFGDSGDSSGKDVPKQIPMARAIELLKPMLESPAVLKIGQNIKYDIEILARHDIMISPCDDTMLLSHVLEGGLHGHGMDELAELHLGYHTIKYKDVVGSGKSQIGFAEVALDKALDYAAEDADVTYRLWQILKPRLPLEKLTTVYETIERPLIHVLTDMEREGILVDVAQLRALSEDFAGRMAEFVTQIHELAGEEFNVGSPKQLGEILFDKMSLPGGKRNKNGAWATGAEVLDDLAAQGHELPQRILDWRQLSKLKSTYTDALVNEINPDTGRIHTNYGMAGASTGRLSSNEPNLQNIPVRTEEGRKIREAFIPKEGCTLISVDYSQIELRLLAHVADIDVLKQAFADGEDIHAITASGVFGIPVEGMDPMIRRKAKAINFGIIYGISAFGLARQLGIERGEAKQYIDAYFERYPGIRDYMDQAKAMAAEKGYVQTLFGRRIHTPSIRDKNPNMRGFAERAAINAPIQGGAADIIKRAMIRVHAALNESNLKTRMLLQVHDELIFEAPEGEVEDAISLIRTKMETAATLSVPLIADAGTGPNWAEAH